MEQIILTSENPILRQVATAVTNFGTVELKEFVDHLLAVMQQKNGAGLAAPQIGASVRIFVYGFDFNPRYPDAPAVPITVAINPEIIWQSEETTDYEEGCLSVPYKRGMITRARDVIFTYHDVAGTKHEKSVSGFEARIVQHETDHINGVLISDRAKVLVTKDVS